MAGGIGSSRNWDAATGGYKPLRKGMEDRQGIPWKKEKVLPSQVSL